MSSRKHWVAIVASVLWSAQGASGDVVAVWNFNAVAGTVPASISSDVGQGELSLVEFTGGLGVLAGTEINAHNNDAAGQSLAITGLSQNTKSLVIDVNTQGKKQLKYSMAARRSSSGFSSMLVQIWDGQLWRDVGNVSANTTQFQLYSLDLSAFTFADNGSLRMRVQFSGATSSSGNARIDNLRVEGTAVPAPGALVAAAAAALAARRGAPMREGFTARRSP